MILLIQEETGNYLKMKAIVEVQYHGKNVTATDIEKLVKEDVKSQELKFQLLIRCKYIIHQKLHQFITLRLQKMVNL